MTEVHPAAAPGRRRILLIATATVVVLASAAAATFALLDRGDDAVAPGSAELPTPRSITRDDVTYRVGRTSPVGITLDAADPRALAVHVFAAESPEQPTCAALEPTARVVDETSTEVRVAAFDYSLRDELGDEPVMCSFTTDVGSGESLYRPLRVRLEAPLGDRQVVDAKSGDVIGSLSHGYRPTPRYVPGGFTKSSERGYSPATDFIALTQYHDLERSSSLEIRVRSVTAWGKSGEVISHDRVGDHEATITEEDYQRCVSWFPRAGLVAEVCSLQNFLDPDELVRIAESVPPVA